MVIPCTQNEDGFWVLKTKQTRVLMQTLQLKETLNGIIEEHFSTAETRNEVLGEEADSWLAVSDEAESSEETSEDAEGSDSEAPQLVSISDAAPLTGDGALF